MRTSFELENGDELFSSYLMSWPDSALKLSYIWGLKFEILPPQLKKDYSLIFWAPLQATRYKLRTSRSTFNPRAIS